MDWSKVRTPAVPRDVRAPQLREVCWQVRGPSRRVITCGVYETSAGGLEVRAGYSLDDLLHSQLARDLHAARLIASAWLGAVRAKGGFEELPGSQL